MTAAVGIANGTFYKFFASKEELIFTILDIEREKAREKIREGVEQLFFCNIYFFLRKASWQNITSLRPYEHYVHVFIDIIT